MMNRKYLICFKKRSLNSALHSSSSDFYPCSSHCSDSFARSGSSCCRAGLQNQCSPWKQSGYFLKCTVLLEKRGEGR